MNKGPNKDQIALDKAKESDKRKKKILQERMEFIQKGVQELQEKAQVRILPTLRVEPQSINAGLELLPQNDKTLEQCLAEYAFKKQQEKEEKKEETTGIVNIPMPKQQ